MFAAGRALDTASRRVPESAEHRRHRPHVTHRIFTSTSKSWPCGYPPLRHVSTFVTPSV